MTEHIELIRDIDGEPFLTAEALSLLFGIDAELITKFSTKSSTAAGTPFPTTWLKAGRRRSREAMAATGHDDILAVLGYWAEKDRGEQVVIKPLEDL